MITKPSRILFFLASLLLVVLGISKLGLSQIDLGAVGIEELDTIPPPPPPADLILDKPTIIGFLRDSLYLDSIKEHLGEEDFYASMDDYMWYTYKLLETSTAAGIELVWEYGSDLTFFVPGHADVLRLKREIPRYCISISILMAILCLKPMYFLKALRWRNTKLIWIQ